jgi:hypothetical protein
MNETGMWKSLSKHMKGLWHAQRHEDLCSSGIADVSFASDGICGWVELKYKSAWPKRKTTPLRLKHFTKEQRIWLKKRGKYCNNVFILISVKDEWLLFRWQATDKLGYMTREEMYNNIHLKFRCGKRFDKINFLYEITKKVIVC